MTLALAHAFNTPHNQGQFRFCLKRDRIITDQTKTREAPGAIRPIYQLRWWIAGLLFASTIINYVNRQTLSLLAPFLKIQYHWTNTDYAAIVIAFRLAYALGQSPSGRLMDRIGARKGLTLSVVWYSIVSMATALASGFWTPFRGCGFFLASVSPATGRAL